MATPSPLAPRRHATFDVICAGRPLWRVADVQSGRAPRVRFRSRIMSTARLLAKTGVRVGLATVLDDDVLGRASLEGAAALGIDVGGVQLAPPATSLVVVDAVGGQSGVLAEGEAERGVDVPPEWSSRVLLLSGLSPVTATAAALCKIARRARRQGAIVVLDLTASLRLWAGRDPRTISMVLREADVVRCTLADLAVLGTDAVSVRAVMRPSGTLVTSDTKGAIAVGAFGEVTCVLERGDLLGAQRAGDSCTAAICAELARPSTRAESVGGRWHRVLRLWTSTMANVSAA